MTNTSIDNSNSFDANALVERSAERAASYDVGATQLYKSIESKDWQATLKRIEEAPLEASTWIFRNEPSGKLRWRLLPIHAAVIFKAPTQVIEALLEAYPEGAECKNDQGQVPVHLAFRNGANDAVLYELLRVAPNVIDAKDNKGRIPIHLHKTTAREKTTSTSRSTPSEDSSTQSSIPPKVKGPGGFALYVKLAVEKERKLISEEARKSFEQKLKAKAEAQRAEIEKINKGSADELKSVQDRITQLETEMTKRRMSSDILMNQFREKCESEEGLRNTLVDAESKLKNLVTGKESEVSRMKEQNGMLGDVTDQLKSKFETLEETNSIAKAQITELIDAKDALEIERDVLRLTVNGATTMNVSLQEQKMDLKEKIHMLSCNLKSMAAEQDKIISAAEKQRQQMESAMNVRFRMLDAVEKQMQDSQAVVDEDRQLIIESAKKQKEKYESSFAAIKMTGTGAVSDIREPPPTPEGALVLEASQGQKNIVTMPFDDEMIDASSSPRKVVIASNDRLISTKNVSE